jgi:hypothetical protein
LIDRKFVLRFDNVCRKEQRVADLTKDFYQMLPHDFGMKRAQNIDHVLRVKDKIKMLESLTDILICEEALINTQVRLLSPNTINSTILLTKTSALS